MSAVLRLALARAQAGLVRVPGGWMSLSDHADPADPIRSTTVAALAARGLLAIGRCGRVAFPVTPLAKENHMSPASTATVDIVMATDQLAAELASIVREQADYRARVDAIAAAVRRADADTAMTALIIALAAPQHGRPA